jgi:hypothetical protein
VATGSCRAAVSCARQNHFAILCQPRRVAKGLENVLALQVGVVCQELVNRVSRSDLAHDSGDGNAKAANTGFSAHDGWVLSYAIKVRHGDEDITMMGLALLGCLPLSERQPV